MSPRDGQDGRSAGTWPVLLFRSHSPRDDLLAKEIALYAGGVHTSELYTKAQIKCSATSHRARIGNRIKLSRSQTYRTI